MESNYKNLLLEIIEEKYKEDGLDKKNLENIFWKIVEFDINSIGFIGEKFVKEVLKLNNITFVLNEKNIHTEYDVLLNNGIKIEIKTARLGKEGKKFQFNGINPHYNFDYLICLGISKENVFYKMFSKKRDFKLSTLENESIYKIKVNKKLKKLTQVNPQNNNVNLKLTLKIEEMEEISKITNNLLKIK